MGSGSSKESSDNAPGEGCRSRSRSTGVRRVFNSSSSSCFFGIPTTLPDDNDNDDDDDDDDDQSGSSSDDDRQEVVSGKRKNCSDERPSMSGEANVGEPCSRTKLLFPRLHKTPSLTSSHLPPAGKLQDGISQIDSGASSSSAAAPAISRLMNQASGRILPRFSFNPAAFGFRLRRTASLGSSSAAPSHFSSSLSTALESDGGDQAPIDPRSNFDDRNNAIADTTTTAATTTTTTTNITTAEALPTSPEMARNNASSETTVSGRPHGNHVDHENYFEARRSSRRHDAHESLVGSVRFSRTLSVGRLRDRVLRGASLSEGLFGPASLEERPIWHVGQPNGRRGLGRTRRVLSSDRSNDAVLDPSGDHAFHRSNSMDGGRSQFSDHIPQLREQLREAGNRDLLEHRSAFLERRRRIRSQVRALQRLGSRFENLSGHDRSCILSGQHRSGRCTCRVSNHPVNPDDDMSTRASISRIVMLAEALFEVLDEIHQQSVVLSSRPSLSSIGSVPAPREVVECMPLKLYRKPLKHHTEEAEQCYICLVEYEEGDCMRILPCNHEFHQMCVDKWLKEIHRVCPLCRGDVCRTDTSKHRET